MRNIIGTRGGKKVDFLICGAQKAGTTALADYLRSHSELEIPETKEIHFFDNEELNWRRPPYREYHRAFSECNTYKKWGEATPIYMYWNAAPRRIWQYNPEMRIIVLLRNPITRAYSHWMMERNRDADDLDFTSALLVEEERCRTNLPEQHRVFSYADRGFYCQQIRRLWHFFGRSALLILRQEDLRYKPQESLDLVCQHLNIKPIHAISNLNRHMGLYEQPMPPEAGTILRGLFTYEIRQLETLLGWDCGEWLSEEGY